MVADKCCKDVVEISVPKKGFYIDNLYADSKIAKMVKYLKKLVSH